MRKGQIDPKNVTKIIGFSPRPNHRIAKGRVAIDGIGLTIEIRVSVNAFTFSDTALIEENTMVARLLNARPRTRSLKV